jgi:hypothetical protein
MRIRIVAHPSGSCEKMPMHRPHRRDRRCDGLCCYRNPLEAAYRRRQAWSFARHDLSHDDSRYAGIRRNSQPEENRGRSGRFLRCIATPADGAACIVGQHGSSFATTMHDASLMHSSTTYAPCGLVVPGPSVRAHEAFLADLHAAVAQQIVRRGDMEEELRQADSFKKCGCPGLGPQEI